MPHPVDIHVGKRLRLRRTLLGLSQEAIGNAIGVTFQQIQKYERGINRMGSSRLYEFSKFLAVPVNFFFEGVEYPQGGSRPPSAFGMSEEKTPGFEHEPPIANRETLELLRAYARITDPAVRKRILELVKSLSEPATSQ